MTDYLARKLAAHERNRCVRVGCEREPQDDHLLCVQCAIDHRARNLAAYYKRTRQLTLPIDLSKFRIE
jgi:hypothetical protein